MQTFTTTPGIITRGWLLWLVLLLIPALAQAQTCTISATAQATCNANGTIANPADDFISFVLTPSNTAQGQRFTVTATQAGNPLALTLPDGSPLSPLSYAYPTPFRTPAGSAGKGNITLTLTDVNNTACTTQVTVTDPGTCAVTACVSTPVSVTYTYRTPFLVTELVNVPLLLPKFDNGGGTRTLTNVALTYKIVTGTNLLLENTSVGSINTKATFSSDGLIDLAGTTIGTISSSATTGAISLPAGITVAAQGTYTGDVLSPGPLVRLSTLYGMNPWLSALQQDIYIDPRLDPRWVTNPGATNNPANDDDIFVWTPQSFSASGVSNYSASGDLALFSGAGFVDLKATTLSGVGFTGAGGNFVQTQSTKAYASASVVYSYTCAACSIATTAISTTCDPATNLYTVNGTISLTSTAGGVATITDGGRSTTITVPAAATSVAYSLTGLTSNAASHTVTVSLPGCGTATATYTAPASCTVAPCSLSASVTRTSCVPATNQYSSTVSVTLVNPVAGTITITDGVRSGTVTVTASTTGASFTFNGLVSDDLVHTVTASLSACGTTSATYTAPASCSVAPVCSVSAIATASVCNTATNQYAVSGTISATNTTGNQSLTVSVGSINTVVTMTGNGPVSYTLSSLNSDGLAHTVTVMSSATACGMASVTYTAPMACTVASLPTYAIAKTVDKKLVERGQIVTYTVSVTNTSAVTATNLVLTDQLSTTAVTLVGSATASAGTFAAGISGGSWSLSSLAGGQVATLSFRAQLNEEGITYNTVTAPNGQTVTTCTTVPAHVCANESFQFNLTAPASYSTYQWTKNGVPIAGAISNTYSVTAIGEYSVQATSLGGCPDGSCCPFVVVADPAPSLTALAISAQCVGQTPQANAAITLVGSSTAAVSYNITRGSSFTAAAPLFGTPQALSAVVGGVLIGGLANPAVAQDYTIRVYSANGCFSDSVVTILPTNCACPPDKCAPFVVKKTKSQGKPVAP